MDNKFRKSQENKEPIHEIAKRVNALLDPILEKTFDLKSRKEYILANVKDYNEKIKEITDRIDNLGLNDIDIKTAEDILAADSEYKKINNLIEKTKPEDLISLDLADEIRKLDSDGRLEKEIPKIYGLPEDLDNWEFFIIFLAAKLPNDPIFWDLLKNRSESIK